MTISSFGRPADESLPGLTLNLGRTGAQGGEIVVVLVAGAHDQRPAARLFHCVFEFVHAVGGIDIDEDEPGERSSKLRQNPLAHVGRPDADPIAFPQSKRLQSDRQVLRAAQEIGICPAHALVAGHERRPIRPFGGDAAQEAADRLAAQGSRRRAVHIGLRKERHRFHPPRVSAISAAAYHNLRRKAFETRQGALP